MTTTATASAARPRGKQPVMFGFECRITLDQITEHHFRVVRDAKEVSIIEVTERTRVVVTLPRAVREQIAPRVADDFNGRPHIHLQRGAARNDR